MQFPTPLFAVFMLALLPLWHALGRRPAARAWLGLGASALFFLAAGPAALACAAAYGALLCACAAAAKRSGRAATAAMAALLCAPLAYFKYSAWIAGMAGAGMDWAWTRGTPFGLSFYTFSGLAWVFAAREGWSGPALQALGAIMGPAVGASGPVLRPKDAAAQLAGPVFAPAFADCAAPFLLGLFLKLAVAARLAQVCDPIFNDPSAQDALSLAVAAHAYGLQLYADFAGYSLMAIGVGRALGVELPSNFEAPYLSRSIGEFWRRWHISLSTFWRERIYFPLGGSRAGRARELANLMAVMLLCGAWHGAGASFLLWGAAHGAMLWAGRLWAWAKLPAIPAALAWLMALEGAMWAWIPFRAADWDALRASLGALALAPSAAPAGLAMLGACALAVAAEHAWKPRILARAIAFGRASPAAFAILAALFAIACVELAPEGIPPFIYSSF